MKHVLVTSRSFGRGTLDLESRAGEMGFQITRGPSHHPLEEMLPGLARAEAWIAGTGPVTAQHMEAAPHLSVIARYGVGVDAVDLETAQRRGIIVTNTPGANSAAVADLAVALMLNGLRHVTHGDREVRAGRWDALPGRELGSLTVGIVGFGRIGQGVSRRLSGFGATVLACDPYVSPDIFSEAGVEATSLNSLCERSDVISLHSPGGEVIVTERRLALMGLGVVLVNTARADLVDEEAMAHAIRAGRVGAFATDVLSGDTSGTASPLLAQELSPHVILTPHLGAQTLEAVDTMGMMALENVAAVLGGTAAHNLVIPPSKEPA